MAGGYDPVTGVISGKGATPGSKVTATINGIKVSDVVKPDGSYSLPALNPKLGSGDAITVTAGNEKVSIKATVVETKSEYNAETGVVSGTGATPGSTVTATLPDGTSVSTVVKPDGTYILPPFSNAPNDGGSIAVDGKPSALIKTPDNTDMSGEYDPKTGTISGTGATPGSTVTATLPDGTQVSAVVKPDGSYSLPTFNPAPVNGQTITIHAGAETTKVVAPDATPMISGYNPATGVITGNGATPGSTVTATLPDGSQVSAIVQPNGSYTLPAFNPAPVNGQTITVHAGTETTTVEAPDTTPIASGYNLVTGVITGTGATPGSTVTATLPDGNSVSATVQPDGSYTLPAFSPAPVNGETITVAAAGETSTIIVDSNAPAMPTVNPTDGDPITGIAEADSIVTIKDATGAVIGTGRADVITGIYSIVPVTIPANGVVLNVTATDAAGNVSATASTTVDSKAPASPTVNPTNGNLITGIAEVGSIVTIKNAAGAVIGTGTALQSLGHTVLCPQQYLQMVQN
jgi:hypothetical protein